MSCNTYYYRWCCLFCKGTICLSVTKAVRLRTWLHLAQQGVVWRASISFLFSLSSDLWRFLFSLKDASKTVVRRSQRDQTKMQGWSVVRGSRISNDWQQSFKKRVLPGGQSFEWLRPQVSLWVRSEPSAFFTNPFISVFWCLYKKRVICDE